MSTLNRYLKAVELDAEDWDADSRWVNADIRPIEEERRKWNFWAYHNFWAIGGFNVSSFMTGSSLIALGLNWWQAFISICVGSACASALVTSNSVLGARYHIGFPVSNRCVWGMYGSFFPILNRILLSIVWYGFQTWIGGECLYVCLMAMDPNIEKHIPNHMAASTGVTSAQFLAYWLFVIICLPLIWIRPHKLTRLLVVSAIVSAILMIALLIWALATMGKHGFGSIISQSTQIRDGSIGWTMVYGIISVIGSLATGILNVNDYARFARKPSDAVVGQGVSVPVYTILGAVVGILVTAATQNRFGEPLWNLPTLFEALIQRGDSGTRAAAFFAGAAMMVSQIGLNIPGNALSGGFDMASVFPRYINIRRGAYITALVSIATNPWKLVTQATTFIAVLGSYSVFTSPMIGLMISSYWIVNRQKIKINDLYVPTRSSIYWYTHGIDWRAIVAWIFGVWPFLPGFVATVNPQIHVSAVWTHLYYCSFILGFCFATVVYVGLHYIFPDPARKGFVQEHESADELVRLYEEQWAITFIDAEPIKPDQESLRASMKHPPL